MVRRENRSFSWNRRRQSIGEVECFTFENTTLPLAVVAALMHTSMQTSNYLASLRLYSRGKSLSLEELSRAATTQVHNLDYKLRLVDALRLSRSPFCQRFRAGRILFQCTNDLPEEMAWQGVADCMSALDGELKTSFLSQPDYDQKYGRSILSDVNNGMVFQTAHEPSAIGTVLAFSTLVERSGIPLARSRWAVIGIGDLGSRVVNLLLEAGVERVLVFDIDDAKLNKYRSHKCVELCPPSLITGVHAVIFSGYSGTLTLELAERIASDRTLIATGGPEAGLDHDERTLATLTRTGKHFVPSILCGSLGLVANLEESLSQFEGLTFASERLKVHLEKIIDSALSSEHTFQDAWKGYATELINS